MRKRLRQVVQMCLPGLKVVAYKFHLIRHVNGTVDKVASNIQGRNSMSKAEEMLRLLEEKIASDSSYESKQLLHMFAGWREEIMNDFDYRIPIAS